MEVMPRSRAICDGFAAWSKLYGIPLEGFVVSFVSALRLISMFMGCRD